MVQEFMVCWQHDEALPHPQVHHLTTHKSHTTALSAPVSPSPGFPPIPRHTPSLPTRETPPPPLLPACRSKNLWTKLHPFVHEFLEAVKDLYELYIYTFGDKVGGTSRRERGG